MSKAYALLIRGWNEIPEIIGSSALMLVGAGIAVYSGIRYVQMDGEKRRYKMFYTVLRPDDPRMRFIRKD